MQSFKFYKNKYTNEWFIDLIYDGPIEDLEMVMGADVMLDILAQGEDEVLLTLSTEEPEHYVIKLTSTGDNMADGMTYVSDWKNNITSFEIWLCSVTKLVFGNFPDVIYVQ